MTEKVADMANRDSDPVSETRSKPTNDVVRSCLYYNHAILRSAIKCTFAIWNEIWSRDAWNSGDIWRMVHL